MSYVRSASGSRFRLLQWGLLALFFTVVGCSQSGSSGGCGGCSQAIPGGFPASQRNSNIVQAKLTRKTFDFLQANTSVLISQFLPNGLNFDIPRSTGGDTEICRNAATCKVAGKLRSLKLNLIPSQTIRVEARLDATTTSPRDIEVRVKTKVLGIKVRKTCKIRVTISNKLVRTDIKLSVDPRTKGLNFVIGTPSFSIDTRRDFRIGGDVVCSGLNLLKGLFKGLIERQVKSALGDALKDINCMKCKVATDCPSGSSCKSGSCVQGKSCLPAPLGVEGQADVGSLLGSFGNARSSMLMYSVKAGARAQVQSSGVNLGTIGGTATKSHPCVGNKTFPKLRPAPSFPFPTLAPDGKNYMVGLGVSQAMMTQAGRDLYRSGMLCLRIDSSVSDQFGSFFRAKGIGGLVSPSLVTMVGEDNPPLYIALRPGAPLDIAIGKGVIGKNAKGDPVVKEPLLEVLIPKLGFDFMMLWHDRWIRLFTYRVDVNLPMGLQVRPGNKLGLILGDLKAALTNPKIENSNILKEDPKSMASGLQNLLNTVLPLLVGQIGSPEFELPDLQGFQLVLRGLTGQMPRQDRADRFQFLGLYADLIVAPKGQPQMPEQVIELQASKVQLPARFREKIKGREVLKRFPRVKIDINLNDTDLEFSWRLNRTLWSAYSSETSRWIESPQLIMEGTHVLEVRARRRSLPQAPVWISGRRLIRVDYSAPTLRLTTSGQGIQVKVNDNITASAKLKLAYRVGARTWKTLQAGQNITAQMLPIEEQVFVRAVDAQGNETLASVRWKLPGPLYTPMPHTTPRRALEQKKPSSPTAPIQAPLPRAGCSTLVTAPSSSTGLWWCGFFALLLFVRRQR